MTRFGIVIGMAVGLLSLPAEAANFGGGAPENPVEVAWVNAKDGNYDDAIDGLKDVLEDDEENVDAWNILGYSYRRTGRMDLAWDAYERALSIDPNHLGANEYLGEWYLKEGDLKGAKAQLEKLRILCPDGCLERKMLGESVAGAESGG